MNVERIYERFPTLCSIADHPRLREDLAAAAAAAARSADRKGLWEDYRAGRFVAGELTFRLCVHEFGEVGDTTADELERHLRAIVDAVGTQQARAAYRHKLLVNGTKPFTDVRYEIGAATGAAAWLDRGSLRLEAALPGAAKNSDLAGERHGVATRLEVRVVHDEWPPRVSDEIEAIVISADVPTGFSVQLRFLPDAATATRAKRLIEELYRAVAGRHLQDGDAVDVAGVTFYAEPMTSGFATGDDEVPIAEVAFEGDRDDRFLSPPAFIRATLDPQEQGWIQNPPDVWVFDGSMADPRTYQALPLSSKIGDVVTRKAKQCADGACNIVVLGTPSPIVGHDVDDGLFGAKAVAYARRPSGSVANKGLVRKLSGIFVPAPQSEDAASLVDPYRKISAVWHVRLGSSAPESRILHNPNATVPLSSADADLLAATLRFPI